MPSRTRGIRLTSTKRFEWLKALTLIGSLCTLVVVGGCGGTDPTLPGVLVVSSASLVFDPVPINTSVNLSFEVKNAGEQAVEIQSITLIEGSLSIFSVEWSRQETLAGGNVLPVVVTFSPSEQKSYTGRIQVRSNDGQEEPLLVSLAGQGSPSIADQDGDGYSPATGDCNDGDPSRFPGNPEVCDGKDNNCDDVRPVEENDSDSDGQRPCQGDCNDSNAETYLGAVETCDGANQDNDCDGVAADTADSDGDGFSVCTGDCNDQEADSAPGKSELCGDTIDNDCDGQVDNIDQDGDASSLCDPIPDCDDGDASAFPLYVDDDASAGNGTFDAPFSTLSQALEHLDATCRTVYVLAGTYVVSASLEDGKELLIRGETVESVVLTPANGRHFYATNESHLTLQQLTLEGGDADGDGGAILAESADVTLREIKAVGNQAEDGGVIAVQSSSLVISESQFESNSASHDGGAVAVVSGALFDSGSIYEANIGDQGGAISVQSSSLELDRLFFQNNQARIAGGGLSAIQALTVRIEQSTFWSNRSESSGGAMSIDDVRDTSGYIRNCLVQTNFGGQSGGGIALSGVRDVIISNNTLVENEAIGQGAGVLVRATSTQSSSLTLTSNLIAWSRGESGLHVESSSVAISYNSIAFTSTSVNYSGVSMGTDSGNNEDDPEFNSFNYDGDPVDDDLTLRTGSPAINSGPSSGSWNDPDGSQNDRGAYGGPDAL